jgi:hypothetical protein
MPLLISPLALLFTFNEQFYARARLFANSYFLQSLRGRGCQARLPADVTDQDAQFVLCVPKKLDIIRGQLPP